MCDFVNQRGQWDWHMIYPFLLGQVQNLLAAIPTPFEDAGPDSLVRFPNKMVILM